MSGTFRLKGTATPIPTMQQRPWGDVVTPRPPAICPHCDSAEVDCTGNACDECQQALDDEAAEAERTQTDYSRDDDKAEASGMRAGTGNSRLKGESAQRVARIITWHKRHGWQSLGTAEHGCFVEALLVSPDGKRVLKIGSDRDEWGRFIVWAHGRQHDRHVPRVYSVSRTRDRWGYTAATMERLHPMDAGYTPTSERLAKRLARLHKEARAVTSLSRGCWDDDSRDAALRGLRTRSLRQTWNDLCRWYGDTPTDCHRNNMMFRCNRSGFPVALVILDPVA